MTYKIAFIVFSTIVSIYVTMVFGKTLGSFLYAENENYGGIQFLLIAGTGWVIHQLWAFFYINDKMQKVKYLTNIANLMLLGVLILLPGKLLAGSSHENFGMFSLLFSILCSSIFMIWKQNHDRLNLGLSSKFTKTWLLHLYIPAMFFLTIFIIQYYIK